MSRSNTITIQLPGKDFSCAISLELPTNPVASSCCGKIFERRSIIQLQKTTVTELADGSLAVGECPCCRKETVCSAVHPAFAKLFSILSDLERSGVDADVDQITVALPRDVVDELLALPLKDQPLVISQTIDTLLTQHPWLYGNISFKKTDLEKIVLNNQFNGPMGQRIIGLLKNCAAHLNKPGVTALLASTVTGRLLLRKNLNVKVLHGEKVLCFGNAALSPESLRAQIDNTSILDLLAREIVVSLDETQFNEAKFRHTVEAQYQTLIDELYERQLIEKESEKIFSLGLRTQFPRWLLQEAMQKTRLTLETEARQEFKTLLSLVRKQGLFRNTIRAGYQYPAHSAVNDLLQKVAYGQRAQVRAMLDLMKDENPILLKTVLTAKATRPIIDHSGKKIENMTLLQAAFAAGDVAIHPDLAKTDPDHQGMCEIIQSYFNEAEDESEITEQYASILERSLCENYSNIQIPPEYQNDPRALHDIHRRAMEQNTFDFRKIATAITRAGSDTGQLTAALNKVGASFTENDAARTKGDDQLNLTESLNRFREKFAMHTLSKVAVNPYDLLKAFEIYNSQYDNWNQDQRNLFVRQVIGFAHRYLSPADARVIAYGLYSAVDDKEKVPDHFDFLYDPGYRLFPFSTDHSCSGLGFDYACMAQRTTDFMALGPQSASDDLSDCIWKTYLEQKAIASHSLCGSAANSIAVLHND